MQDANILAADNSVLTTLNDLNAETDSNFRHFLPIFAMASMNISIPAPMRDWVLSRVETGAYAGASDHVRELIRRDQEAARAPGLSELDAAVELALADAEDGRTKPAAEVLDRLSAKYAAMAEDDRRR